MTGDVRKGFLRRAKHRLARARRERRLGWQRARFERHVRAGAESERFTLLSQRGDETRVLERRGLQLVEHDVHFSHRLAGRGSDLLDGDPGAVRIGVETRLRRCRRRLNHEELLLHRIMEIARQPGALFLPDGLANLLLVLRPQRVERRTASQSQCAPVVLHHPVFLLDPQRHSAEIGPGPGEGEVKQHDACSQCHPSDVRRQHQGKDRDPLPQEQQAEHDVSAGEPGQAVAPRDRIRDAGEAESTHAGGRENGSG